MPPLLRGGAVSSEPWRSRALPHAPGVARDLHEAAALEPRAGGGVSLVSGWERVKLEKL